MFLRKFPRYLLLLSLIALLLSYTAGLSSTGSVFTDCDSNGPINLVAAWEEAAALACM
ncbi:MAG TPA: hypothetical protein GX693_01195, partial [Firmicutes bacterium]|nr:hypothetical protein [Bacillota bacterium]